MQYRNWEFNLYNNITRSYNRLGIACHELQRENEKELRTGDISGSSANTLQSFEKLWGVGIDCYGSQALPLVLGREAPADFGLVGILAKYAPTLKDALRVVAYYWSLFSHTSRMKFTEHEEFISLEFCSYSNPTNNRYSTEYILSSLLSLVRRAMGSELAPVRSAFSYDEPRIVSEYYRTFRSALVFGHSSIELRFDLSRFDAPVRAQNRELFVRVQQLADELMAEQAENEHVLVRLRGVLVGQLKSGRISLDDVAARLAMSPRTLQRHLEKAGTSYSEVIGSYRKEVAEQLLASPQYSLKEIALLLGYSNTTNFGRAFKQWFGMAPQEYRRGLGSMHAQGPELPVFQLQWDQNR